MKRKVKVGLRVDGWASHSTEKLINFIIERQEALSLFNFQLCRCTSPDHLTVYWLHPNYIPAYMGNPYCCPYFAIKTVL